jgi:hypothetical protein
VGVIRVWGGGGTSESLLPASNRHPRPILDDWIGLPRLACSPWTDPTLDPTPVPVHPTNRLRSKGGRGLGSRPGEQKPAARPHDIPIQSTHHG